jgi:multidrug efflux pump subunit AcrA (membrane-fusion protein)
LLMAVGAAIGLVALKKQPDKKAIPEASVVVSVADIKPYAGVISLELTGLVVPFREINLVSEVTGRVVFKAEEFRPGNYVAAGTLLMQVDQTDYDLEITRLEADLAQSASALAELEVEVAGVQELVAIATRDLELQESDFQRKRDINAGFSQAELDQAQRAVLAARNALATQANRLSLLEQSRNRLTSSQTIKRTDLELARIRRNRCLITAPADGVIVSESVELNGFVQPGAALLTFEDTSRAEIRCNLRTDQLEWLWRHAPAAATEVSADAAGLAAAYRIPRVPVRVLHEQGSEQLEGAGVLDRYDGFGVDERTKTTPARVVVAEPIAVGSRGSRALVRGMFVNLRIELPTQGLRELNQFFAELPAKSLLPGNSVWVHRDGQLLSRELHVVNTVESAEGRRVIVELQGDGVLLTDQVVTSPVGTYTPEMKVRVLGRDDRAQPAASGSGDLDLEKTRLTGQISADPERGDVSRKSIQ